MTNPFFALCQICHRGFIQLTQQTLHHMEVDLYTHIICDAAQGCSSATAKKGETTSANNSNVAGWKPISTSMFQQRISEIAKKKGGCRLQKVNVHHTWSRRMLHNTPVYFLSHISCVYLFCGWKKKKHWTIEIWFPHEFHSFFQTFYFCFMHTSFVFWFFVRCGEHQ